MALNVGDKAPAFSAKDANGNTVSLAGLSGKKFVIYFYPKDDTPGCTKEACSFRDNWGTYRAQGIEVYGVSRDDAASHQAFASKYELPFSLLVDTDGSLSRAFDVDGGGYAKRVTFIVGPDGTIEQVYTTVNTATHATDILETIGA
ncbi:peroxiredoxin [Gloeobacter kilaueensis]|uniref:thioredoxin-dependent peroxiredoxin n=1 Tax=Gloeobacter kilaueensis (strain ATCC BAA-2537 / CCAP 1431/1 / ULC 316 / JS1) TaxID=1183438 RepID=U5QNZ6_GLOK1|nr:peroxiredoxin [Gloeobacter kilaueensis]AGY60666.1 alkyl hydroperoxide reductase/ Thiol specific antioxidant/ Mal allergen [Gloeobacter kilaueensis JS1]